MFAGIISAMDSEHRRLTARLSQPTTTVTADGFHYVEGRLGNNRLVLTQCGIGKVSAAMGTLELIRRFRPDCILSTGVAGGIDTRLRVADVVVSRAVVYHDVWCGPRCVVGQVQGYPERFAGHPELLAAALSTRTEGLDTRIMPGLICTGDRFITARDELDAIKSRFAEGLAVDMESAAIAQTCHRLGTPFLSFRIISDTPGVDNHLAQYDDFWGQLADRSFQVTMNFLANLPERLEGVKSEERRVKSEKLID